jgi:hypothetical protein
MTDAHVSERGYQVAASVAGSGAGASFLLHIAVLLRLVEAKWAWSMLVPLSAAALLPAGLIAWSRGRGESGLTRYSSRVQGWLPCESPLSAAWNAVFSHQTLDALLADAHAASQ